MEDGVWSQIMKIQPIVEHEPPHEGVEGEAQASEEVRDKHNALIGLRCRDNLPWSRKPVLDIYGQVSDLPMPLFSPSSRLLAPRVLTPKT